MTDTIVAPTGGRAWAERFARDTLTITRRNLLRLSRNPQVIMFSTVQPLMFVLLFNYVFGGSIALSGLDYIDFLIPGVLVQTALFGGGQTGIGITQDLQKGAIDRFLSLPMSRAAVLFGRTGADSLRALVPACVVLLVGHGIGFRAGEGLIMVVPAVLVSALFGYAFNWVFTVMALYIRDPEAVQAAIFLPTFPLVFAGSTFAPVENMPDWLRVFAANQPVTATVDAIRAMMHGGEVAGPLVQSLLWSAGIIGVSVAISIRKLNRLWISGGP